MMGRQTTISSRRVLRPDGGESVVDFDALGMSLRDWFAGQAIVGEDLSQNEIDLIAAAAYNLADAMIAERSKR